jgi:hypothetical protein
VIVQGLIDILKAILTPVFALLPTGSLSSWFGTAEDTIAHSIGQMLGTSGARAFFPVDNAVSLISATVAILIPAVIAYKVANWIYKHVPQLWGFGPGSG